MALRISNLLGLLVFSLVLRVCVALKTALVAMTNPVEKNVLGQPLQVCGTVPLTGFYRDGYCRYEPEDVGVHTVCSVVTEDFLKYTKSRGNDLSTPAPQFRFPGLKAGDRWCLCAARWEEARIAGHAPPVVLESTSIKCLDVVTSNNLKQNAFAANAS